MPRTIEFKGSSNVRTATLDDDGTCLVTFAAGPAYRYANFTAEMFKDWEAAESPGGWLHRTVKSKPKDFPATKLAAAPGTPGAPVVDEAGKTVGVILESAGDRVVASVTDEATMAKLAAGAASTSTSTAGAPELRADAAFPADASEPASREKVDHAACSEAVRADARRLYEAYIANSDGKAWDGRPCPAWDDLGEPVRSHWCATLLASMSLAARPVQAEITRLVSELGYMTADRDAARAHALDMATVARRLTEQVAAGPAPNRRRTNRPWRDRRGGG